MILIADSGSTKTDWCIVFNDTPIKRIGTKGINPFFQSEEEIQQELTHSLLPQLPEGTIKEAFLKQFDLTAPEIIDRVYRQPFPNRFLASLSPFIAQHLEEPGIRQLVLDSFIAFFRRNVMQYDYTQYPVHFIGSVAHCYREILQEAAQETGIRIGKILQSPMEGLILYHTASSQSL